MFFLANFWLLKAFRGIPNAFQTIFSKKKKSDFSDFFPISPILLFFWQIVDF